MDMLVRNLLETVSEVKRESNKIFKVKIQILLQQATSKCTKSDAFNEPLLCI